MFGSWVGRAALTAYAEPSVIVLNQVGSSWQGTARNGGFFVVGDFAETREKALTICLEKYRAKIEKMWKPAPKKAYDPLEDI